MLIKTEQAIRDYASLHGWPSQSEWNKFAKENGFLGVQGIYYHTNKTWNDYRDIIGFKPREHRFTKDECLNAMRQASSHLGQFFTRKEYEAWQKLRPELPTHAVITRRFGGWNQAKREVELIPNASWGKEFTDQEIINALQACSRDLGMLYSEEEYMTWRNNKPDIPHIETIRKRLDGIPEAKRKIGLQSYDCGGPDFRYSNGRWKEPMLGFLRDQLSHTAYENWLKYNIGPSLDAIWDHAGGYEKALIECLCLYVEKIEAGRKKR